VNIYDLIPTNTVDLKDQENLCVITVIELTNNNLIKFLDLAERDSIVVVIIKSCEKR
jgi:hypothetical protein